MLRRVECERRFHNIREKGLMNLSLFEGLNGIAFMLSLVLWAGGGIAVSVFFFSLKDPKTQPQVQGFLYSLWDNLRLPGVAISIILLGTSLSKLILGVTADLFWLILYFAAFALTLASWHMADRSLRKGSSDPRSILEVERKSFGLYLLYADSCIVLATVALALAGI